MQKVFSRGDNIQKDNSFYLFISFGGHVQVSVNDENQQSVR